MSNPPRPYYDKKTSTKHRFVGVRREGYLTLNQNLPIITNLILLQAPHPSMNEPLANPRRTIGQSTTNHRPIHHGHAWRARRVRFAKIRLVILRKL